MIKIYKFGQVSKEQIFARAVPEVDVESIVSQIIADVIKNGDQALREILRSLIELILRLCRSPRMRSMMRLRLLILLL